MIENFIKPRINPIKEIWLYTVYTHKQVDPRISRIEKLFDKKWTKFEKNEYALKIFVVDYFLLEVKNVN